MPCAGYQSSICSLQPTWRCQVLCKGCKLEMLPKPRLWSPFQRCLPSSLGPNLLSQLSSHPWALVRGGPGSGSHECDLKLNPGTIIYIFIYIMPWLTGVYSTESSTIREKVWVRLKNSSTHTPEVWEKQETSLFNQWCPELVIAKKVVFLMHCGQRSCAKLISAHYDSRLWISLTDKPIEPGKHNYQ